MNFNFNTLGPLDNAIILAILITLFSITALRPFAISISLVDSPNNRKKHVGTVPLIGGIAMFFGFTISLITVGIDLSHYKYF